MCLSECQSFHRCWAPRCQSLLAAADRQAVMCVCGRGRVALTQRHLSVWTLIFLLLPVLRLLIAYDVSACFAPPRSPRSLCLLQASLNVSPGPNFRLSDTFPYSLHLLTIQSLFFLFSPCKQLLSIYHMPHSWEFLGTILHKCLSTPLRDDNTECSEISAVIVVRTAPAGGLWA